MNTESRQTGLVWIPSRNPDLVERRLRELLARFPLSVCRTERQVLEALKKERLGVVVVNGPTDHCDPVALLNILHAESPNVSFFVRHIDLPISVAVELARNGATGVFGQEADEFAVAAGVEICLVSPADRQETWRGKLVGESSAVEHICSMVRLVANRRGTVLLTGESGTGKEVVARAIHAAGSRAARPFVAVNCGAIPGPLLESELFGHVRGAFTGAHVQRLGRFEQAQGGSILLDEIGDLGPELQSKLLRVLQEREMQRLGSSETISLDVRVLAATHANLVQKVSDGSFREDLFYRLNVIPIEVPPLRERRSDIPLLARHFLARICAAEAIIVRELTPAAQMLLTEYSWPGNIRQLENALERAAAFSGERTLLTPEDFSLPQSALDREPDNDLAFPDGGFDYERAVNRFEWNLLSQALRKARGNKKAAADLLGLKRTTLAAKVKVLSTSAGDTIM